jgi:hypothetical protein
VPFDKSKVKDKKVVLQQKYADALERSQTPTTPTPTRTRAHTQTHTHTHTYTPPRQHTHPHTHAHARINSIEGAAPLGLENVNSLPEATRAVVVRLFSAKGSKVFGGRTVAIAAELEDAGNGMSRPGDPLRWHMVRSGDAEPNGLFDADACSLLQEYVRRKKDEELVVELVEMHGSSIDFDAANATAGSVSRHTGKAPLTRQSATPSKEDLPPPQPQPQPPPPQVRFHSRFHSR